MDIEGTQRAERQRWPSIWLSGLVLCLSVSVARADEPARAAPDLASLRAELASAPPPKRGVALRAIRAWGVKAAELAADLEALLAKPGWEASRSELLATLAAFERTGFPALLRAIDAPSAGLRMEARVRLSALTLKRTDEYLLLLEHEDAGVRLRAFQWLVERDPAGDTTPLLVRALDDAEPLVRELAARVLTGRGAHAIPELAKLRRRRDGVSEVGRREAGCLMVVLAAESQEGTATLFELLGDPDQRVARAALSRLAGRGGAIGRELEAALGAPRELVRAGSAELIGRLGPEGLQACYGRRAALLQRALFGLAAEDGPAGLGAAGALARLGFIDKSYWAICSQATRQVEQLRRPELIGELVRLGPRGLEMAEQQGMIQNDETIAAFYAGALALGSEARGVLPGMRERIGAGSMLDVVWGAEALARLAPRDPWTRPLLAGLLSAQLDEAQAAVARALRALPSLDEHARIRLWRVFTDGPKKARVESLRTLLHFAPGQPRIQAELLARGLHRADRAMRVAIEVALTVPDAQRQHRLEGALRSPDLELRIGSLEALGLAGSPGRRAVSALMAMLRGRDEDGAALAAAALRRAGPRAIPALRWALVEEGPLVVTRAARIIASLGPAARRARPQLLARRGQTTADAEDLIAALDEALRAVGP